MTDNTLTIGMGVPEPVLWLEPESKPEQPVLRRGATICPDCHARGYPCSLFTL